jgi:DNA-binding protein YbaB
VIQRSARLAADTAEVLDGIHEVITGLADARGRCQALTVTATAEHGCISVVADGSGTVARIDFADDVEDLGYARIARSTVRAAQAAGAEVKRRAEEIMAPLRDKLARLPKPDEMLSGLTPVEIPTPPPALLTPPSERPSPPGELSAVQHVTPPEMPTTPLGEGVPSTGARMPSPGESTSDAPGTDGALTNPEPAPPGGMADIVRLQKARALLIATGTAERRRVAVTVNADGILIDIRFSSGISDLVYDEIAEAIVEASRQAVAEVARRATALFTPVSYDRSQFPGIAATLAGLDNLRNQLR